MGINRYQMIGYIRYDADLKKELTHFLEYVSNNIKYTKERQAIDMYNGADVSYTTLVNPYYGFGLTCVLPFTQDARKDVIKHYVEKYAIFPREIFREIDTIPEFHKWRSNRNIDKLKDIHHGLPHQELVGGRKYLTVGDCYYYHVEIDDFKDVGWGHTYRALQIILSWYWNNKYLESVPSILEIQKMIVDQGERDPIFEGSEETIGAYEVGVVLKKLLNVESTVLYIGNGKLVPEQADQLKEHFKDEQTPVLIGGGIRAFVLLGIDYNEIKHEVQFLIVNPNFEGKATKEVLQEKEWVSWKESSFFLKDNFYNFCLPKAKNMVFE